MRMNRIRWAVKNLLLQEILDYESFVPLRLTKQNGKLISLLPSSSPIGICTIHPSERRSPERESRWLSQRKFRLWP